MRLLPWTFTGMMGCEGGLRRSLSLLFADCIGALVLIMTKLSVQLIITGRTTAAILLMVWRGARGSKF